VDYSVQNLLVALSTLPPSSIVISPNSPENYFKWEFSWPSALRVIAVLSPSQSQTMATGIEAISVTRPMPRIGFGEQQRFSGFED
jgi:hypothetical protein